MSSLTERASACADPPLKSFVTPCTHTRHAVTESGTVNSREARPSASVRSAGRQNAVSAKFERSWTSGAAPAPPALPRSPSTAAVLAAGAGAEAGRAARRGSAFVSSREETSFRIAAAFCGAMASIAIALPATNPPLRPGPPMAQPPGIFSASARGGTNE